MRIHINAAAGSLDDVSKWDLLEEALDEGVTVIFNGRTIGVVTSEAIATSAVMSEIPSAIPVDDRVGEQIKELEKKGRILENQIEAQATLIGHLVSRLEEKDDKMIAQALEIEQLKQARRESLESRIVDPKPIEKPFVCKAYEAVAEKVGLPRELHWHIELPKPNMRVDLKKGLKMFGRG